VKIRLILISAIVLLAGCTSTYSVKSDPFLFKVKPLPSGGKVMDYYCAMVNEKTKGKIVVVSTVQNENIKAVILHVAADSISFVNIDAGFKQNIPTSSLHSISLKNSGTAALDGFMYGGAIGSLTGLILTPIELGHGGGQMNFFPVGVLYLYYASLGAVGGSVLGSAIGAIIGHTDKYIFEPNNVKSDTTSSISP
jgi:hypothetical protein